MNKKKNIVDFSFLFKQKTKSLIYITIVLQSIGTKFVLIELHYNFYSLHAKIKGNIIHKSGYDYFIFDYCYRYI